MLCKIPCTVTHLLDTDDCPLNDGTEYSSSDFPVYYNLLYHSDMYPDIFFPPFLVCGWLWSCFEGETLWHNIHVEFHEGVFYVEDVSIDLQICLSPLDITSACFCPCIFLLHCVSSENRCNLLWIYTSETELVDSFNGIMVRVMSAITTYWQVAYCSHMKWHYSMYGLTVHYLCTAYSCNGGMCTGRSTVKDRSMRHPNIEGPQKGEKKCFLTSAVRSIRQAMIRT